MDSSNDLLFQGLKFSKVLKFCPEIAVIRNKLIFPTEVQITRIQSAHPRRKSTNQHSFKNMTRSTFPQFKNTFQASSG